MPECQAGEHVVFVAHFERGFGLPVSDFTKEFFETFLIQPHHLPANAITTLSAYITFAEAYLGIWPTVDLWAKYFQFRQQVVPDPENPLAPKQMVQCGAATVIPRRGSIFPRIRGLESCKKWLRSFFYVKNTTEVDMIRLPKFSVGPPLKRHNWEYDPKDTILEVNQIHEMVRRLKNDEGMTADDLLATFVDRRISPLQRRTHKMCHMSGRHDPNRITTIELTKAEVQKRVRAIAKTNLADNWLWGKIPHSREYPVPAAKVPENCNRYIFHAKITFHADITFCLQSLILDSSCSLCRSLLGR